MAKRSERRRDQRQQSSGAGGSGKIVWVLIGAGVLGIALVAWNVVTSITDETVRSPVELVYDTPQELVDLASGVTSGNPDAPVTIMEFADYQCPSCQAFWQQAKPFIDMTYVDNGQAQLVFFDFPLTDIHPHAFLAARAARCAGDQDSYWAYHDQLFQMQATWARQADPAGLFVDYAGEVGLNQGDFESCLRSDAHAEVVSANRLLGAELGVQGTPTVLIDVGDGQVRRMQSWGVDEIRAAIDEALAAQETSEGDGA